jgi:iron complex outermembrane receptor protein
MTSADIEDLGAVDVAEVVQAMPWSSGSQTRASTFQGEGANGQNSLNLRNLGHGATLPLVNGKRNVPSWYNTRGNASVNINGLIPNIALERIEIVKDGASALYGSDAVAGVVNFITKSDFEGFDFTYQYTTDEETREGDANTLGLIWGVQGDRGGIVASASYLKRDEINVDDNFSRFGGTTISSTGQPGRLTPRSGQEIRWAPDVNHAFAGQIVDAETQFPNAPGSEQVFQAGGTNGTLQAPTGNLPRNRLGTDFGESDVNCEDAAALERGGALGTFANRCVYDYGSFFAIQSEESLRKMFIQGDYALTDSVRTYFELASNESEFDRLNSLNPNAPALEIPTSVRGQPNPGSVEDAFRRGIVPINYSNLTRLQGGTRATDTEHVRPLKTFTDINRTDTRYVLGFEGDQDFGNRQWTWDLSYTASHHKTRWVAQQDTLSSHMELAIQGLGGPDCDAVSGAPGDGNQSYSDTGGEFSGGSGNCYFFNPVGNSQYDRNGNQYDFDNLTPDQLKLVNPPELYSWLGGRASTHWDFRQRVIDFVAAGDLFDLGDNAVGLAIGFQRRRDTGKVLQDSSLTSNNLDFVFGAQDWEGKLTTTAVFAEMGIPIGNTFQVNLAVRYEDFKELDIDTTDPKITLLWQPFDSLSLRASGGSSFKVPSLQQSFGSITTVANEADLVGGTTFKPSITTGNPELTPESADNWGIGVSWIPQGGFLEGLQIDLDYFDYDYKDIITRETPSTLLRLDNEGLIQYAADRGCVAADEDCTALYIEAVQPGNEDARRAAGGNPDQVIRNDQAVLLRMLPKFANANGADISGLDLNSSYTFDTGIGNWRIGLQAAWIDTYEVEAEIQGITTVFDGVGSYNETNPVARPLPEWKVNGTLNWSMNNHRAFLIVKYVDAVDSDISNGLAGFFAGTAELAGNGHLAEDLRANTVKSFTTADIQYTYSFGQQWIFNDSHVTIGVLNLTDESPPIVPEVTAYSGILHDGRGRMWMLRVGGSM